MDEPFIVIILFASEFFPLLVIDWSIFSSAFLVDAIFTLTTERKTLATLLTLPPNVHT